MKTIDSELKKPEILKGIIIPTGNFKQDKERFLVACRYNSQKCGGDANLLVKPRFFGVDRNSVTSAENLLFSFPDVENDSGKYAIVSYPLHLLRFRFLQRAMKLSGR